MLYMRGLFRIDVWLLNSSASRQFDFLYPEKVHDSFTNKYYEDLKKTL